MSKNLGKYKQELQTRECLVQAIYQYIFHDSNLNSLIDQFLKENTPKKISFNYFKQRLENIFEQSDDLKEITRDLKNNEGESLEIIDEAILWLGIVEIRANKPIGFGLIAVENLSQAQERTDSSRLNKGKEIAQSLVEMLS